MAGRIVLAKSFDPTGPSEDWWFLVIEDGDEMHVEHKQVRHNPFKRIRKDIRTRGYSIEELLATTRHEPRGSLRHALKQRGIQQRPEPPKAGRVLARRAVETPPA